MIDMGTATLLIIVFPIHKKFFAEKASRLRVSVNHVPQNTPVTNMTSTRLKLLSIMRFIIQVF